MKVLGVTFFAGTVEALLQNIRRGGLLVVPSAPVLVQMSHDEVLRNAVQTADLAIADSMLMVLLHLLLAGKRIRRTSGLTFLREFLTIEELKQQGSLFLVNPDEQDGRINREYVSSRGIPVSDQDSYVAPMYGNAVEDPALLDILRKRSPKYVLINLGGGVQEKLGYYLRDNLDYRPAIVCTGAAIAFLTGRQASIPAWADKAGLGWLYRCVHNPAKFVPRYLSAFRLAWIMLKCRVTGRAPGTDRPKTEAAHD